MVPLAFALVLATTTVAHPGAPEPLPSGTITTTGSPDETAFTPTQTWVSTDPGRVARPCPPEARADECDAIGTSLTIVALAPTDDANSLAVMHLIIGAPPGIRIEPGKYRIADFSEFDPNPAEPIAFVRFSRSQGGKQSLQFGVSGSVELLRVTDTEVEGRFEATFRDERLVSASFTSPVRKSAPKPDGSKRAPMRRSTPKPFGAMPAR